VLPFGLSLDTGLMITIVILLILYLLVLIKLKPSTESKKILETDLSKQKIVEEPVTERQVKPPISTDPREEPFERPEPAPPLSVKTEKTEMSKETLIQGCPHHFGYLSEYPKNTPIPNECLTCTNIMECLLKRE